MSTYKKPNIKQLQAACDAFNAKVSVGGRVRVTLDGIDEPRDTVTRSEAQILGGHTAVVWMEGVSGCYDLECVTPIQTIEVVHHKSGDVVEQVDVTGKTPRQIEKVLNGMAINMGKDYFTRMASAAVAAEVTQ